MSKDYVISGHRMSKMSRWRSFRYSQYLPITVYSTNPVKKYSKIPYFWLSPAAFLLNSIIAPKLSPSSTFFLFVCPHFVHLNHNSCFLLLDSIPTGSIIPPHAAARSPGCTSTCLDHKHRGQWFVYPVPWTSLPQCSQTKSSTFFWKLMNFDPNCRSTGRPITEPLLMFSALVKCLRRSCSGA